ncbi:cancer/testis antigen 55-like [Perognathus longimembris pacificus]|uniref:cancer/testis antigen 55-like n=1 Tax=Perognathus longimembris pacificus TaxID=214514 RepID=UPI002018A02C|nr:cancer/testis antigen 55-like [Perognathus longimembris pacificus]
MVSLIRMMGDLAELKSPSKTIKVKSVKGVVTKVLTDHGWIDETIFFRQEDVTGNVPLHIGRKVRAIVEEDRTGHGWKAIKVDALYENYCDEPSETDMDLPFGTVASGVHVETCVQHTTCFSLDVVCKDFEPYEGDLLEVVFSFQTEMQRRQAISVKPLRHKHVHEVFITSVYGRDGVVDNNIFFTLDSLEVPTGYEPQLHDRVNVLVVESAQPGYSWRAISMAPVHMR